MRLLFITLIILFVQASEGIEKELLKTWQEKTVRSIISRCRAGRTNHKTEQVLIWSYHYGVDPIVMARLGVVESSFNQYKKNGPCIGLYQINTNIHRLQNPHNIAENTKKACDLVRRYYIQTGSYKGALTIFGGWAGKWNYRQKQCNNYLAAILP